MVFVHTFSNTMLYSGRKMVKLTYKMQAYNAKLNAKRDPA